jgi:hypothetical protein
MPRLRIAAATVVLPCLIAAASPAGAVPLLPDFGAASFVPRAAIDNEYFPLLPGMFNVLKAKGVDEDGEPFSERTQRSFAGAGPKILGVRATTMLDKAFEDGLLVERTKDYFAQDTVGNVWYLGEDVKNFHYDDDGNLIGTDNESAWRAGRNGALPGYIMPVSKQIGFNYFQEHAPRDEALDHGKTFALLESLTVAGTTYSNVLQVLERSRAEPGARDFKFYASGIGLIREAEGLDANLMNPELTFNRDPAAIPLPAPLLLIVAGIGSLAALRRRRQSTTTRAPIGTRS